VRAGAVEAPVGPVVAVGIAGSLVSRTAGSSGALTPARSGHVAQRVTEACSEEVRGAIEAALGTPLAAAQQGNWQASRYVCAYPVGGGTLFILVDVFNDSRGATAAFTRTQRATPQYQRLNGLGQDAFQRPDGLFVARKDIFVIRIDPSAVPAQISHSDVAFAAAVQLLACWAGVR
jgi:hypothetical protein